MKYGYFNAFITDIQESVPEKTDELKAFASEIIIDTMATRENLLALLEKLQPEDIIYVHNFTRFSSGLRDLVDLIHIIVNEKKAALISLHDDFDSSTPEGKSKIAAFETAVPLINTDPNYGFYK
ncbi:Resolvase%2C N terminal domain [uncultured Roseburia sp.]|uniref:Recombinase family protein n=1 Tax=Brotonthovivens ammoniilytica TaxID=2981725 RepID=A0ABT2THU0_9FIRM|nr:recombinase family protein [Brotonthovivens ammoniilytica]MCU6761768.1 recombinase family protein [Brotonthovivens ammoniilytica]SCI46008.1 Resolvase%2C N terminal domain [uncultured Roseburia sp.]